MANVMKNYDAIQPFDKGEKMSEAERFEEYCVNHKCEIREEDMTDIQIILEYSIVVGISYSDAVKAYNRFSRKYRG